MDKSTLENMERKFDFCYLLAKEDMAFKMYPALYSLEESNAWKCLELNKDYYCLYREDA